MSEFVSDALDHTLFKGSRETSEKPEMELVVASLGRVSLDGRREHLIGGLGGLIDSVKDHVLDEFVAELLQHTLVEHGRRPCFVFATVKHRHTIDFEASMHHLDFSFVKNYKYKHSKSQDRKRCESVITWQWATLTEVFVDVRVGEVELAVDEKFDVFCLGAICLNAPPQTEFVAFVREVEPHWEGIHHIGDVPVLLGLAIDVEGELGTAHVVLKRDGRLNALEEGVVVDALSVGTSVPLPYGVSYIVDYSLFLEFSKVLKCRLVHMEGVAKAKNIANLEIRIKSRHSECKWIFEHKVWMPIFIKYVVR